MQLTAPAASAAASFADAHDVLSCYGEFWRNTTTLAADFSQAVHVPGIEEPVRTGGRFYFAAPDHFRWDYTAGERQTVVGDGTSLWIHQHELEQVYRLDYRRAFGGGGLVALMGDTDLLESRYRSEVLEPDGPRVTLRLEKAPVSEHAAAETVEIVLRQPDCRPVSLQLTDAIGSVTRMELAELELDTVLAERLFHFEVPAGVDLIEEPAASAPEAASPAGTGAEGGAGR